MAKSKSKLGLSQRRERAYEMFARGYTNTDVARELNVNKDTVTNYRKKYESSLHAQAASNPGFLQDVVANTIRSLTELDRIRADAWKRLKDRKIRIEVQCPHCDEEFTIRHELPVTDETAARYHGVLLKAQDQRSKLFGVIGIKQEVFVAILQVKVVQDKILDWLGEHLTGSDREALAEFLESSEIAAYTQGQHSLGTIDTTAIEAASRAS